MSIAYFTMDDGPTRQTPQIIDYLNERKITPIFMNTGMHIEEFFEEGVYALQHGAIVGNHSYSHPGFSSLTYEQAIEEIEHTEELLEKMYKAAGVLRKAKLFRFPYGDKGKETKDKLQQYLKDHGFVGIDDRMITQPWYHEYGCDKSVDVFWTYDFAEYRTHNEPEFTYETILSRIEEAAKPDDVDLFGEHAHHLLLIHDHEETAAIIPNYYQKIIDYVLERGLQFIEPAFIKK